MTMQKIWDLIREMTLEEKIGMIHGQGIFHTKGVERLGIPPLWMSDGPMGVRKELQDDNWAPKGTTDDYVSYLPSNTAIACTWNRERAADMGCVLGQEARGRGKDVILAPGINLIRSPLCGRNFEYMSEDPHLISEMAVPLIRGIEEQDTAACVKHFAAHSGPEKGRHSFNSVVSKKDLAETYFPAFERCVKEAGVEGVMGGYNRLNGEAACGSHHLITEILREKWGFDGYYVSDCGAIKDFHMHHGLTDTSQESAALALKSGCDLNCGAVYLHVMSAYNQGLVSEDDIDRAVTHLMMTRMRLGMFDQHTEFDEIPYEVNDCAEHHSLALKAAEESMVLLKNDGILPLDKTKLKTVAVIGPNSDSEEILKGNYNGTATEKYTLLEGIRAVLGKDTRIFCSEGAHLYRDNVENLAEADDRIKEAVSMAMRSDVVFLCLGLNGTLEGEEGDANNSYAGADKVDLNLPESQIRLLKAVCETGTPVILLLSTGSAMAISDADEHCSAILHVWYPGQMGGLAAARLLMGEAVPSGRLPVTFYRTTEELPDFTDYSMKGRTYRYMEHEALYPFGYGLSYGDFEYSNLKAEQIETGQVKLSVEITNHSMFECDEVAEVYVRITDSELAAPGGSLADFKRIHLKAGESAAAAFILSAKAFMVVNEEGEFVFDGSAAVVTCGGSQPDGRSVELTGKTPLKLDLKLEDLKW